MSYVPVNDFVYAAAYSGCYASMKPLSINFNPGPDPSDPSDISGYLTALAPVAAAFAQMVDTVLADMNPTELDLSIIESVSEDLWGKPGVLTNTPNLNPNNYLADAQRIRDVVVKSRDYFTSQGISFPAVTDTSVANAAALTAFPTAGLPLGTSIYVQTYRQSFRLQPSSASVVRPHSVLASDNVALVWVRDLTPGVWTYQYNWFYNKDTGNDENDGSSAAAPIQSLDEFCRRVRTFSAGINGVQTQYNIHLQTDVAAADTWFPSGNIQADNVQIGKAAGEVLFMPTIIGYRRAVSVPGGSGVLTAASTLALIASNAKATLTDSNALFGSVRGQMVMVSDAASAAIGTGAVASIASLASGVVTLTGGTGFTTGSVNRMVTITGAATPANNGTFPITEFVSATSIKYSNPNAVAPDANNGAITWVEKPAKISFIINAPGFTTGGGVTVTAVSAGFATLAGAPAATFAATDVGKRIRMSGGIAANNGDFTIVAFISATSVQIANVNAAVDATAQTFQGVVEVGPSWYDQATLLVSAAAPAIGSPYTVVSLATVPQRSWGAGKPNGVAWGFVDCFLTTNIGIASSDEVRPTTCQLNQAGGFIAGGAGANTQSLLFATLCCWTSAAPFGTIVFQENGYNRLVDCATVDFNVFFREAGTQFTPQNLVVQGGFVGPAGDEAAGRNGSALGMTPGMARSIGVFNNVANSNIHPPVASGSAGFAIVLARNSRCISAGTNGGHIWGVGALGGIHVKEKSLLSLGASGTPTITDSAGQAGFSVAEVKLDAGPPIPVASATTGVPAAVVTTSGVATTFVAANGIVTITDAGAAFTAASVGRTVTIAGANTPANNGTYVIESFVGATSVRIRNPAGVTDAVIAGTMTENAVVTKWAQLAAAPYSGNAMSYTGYSSVTRVAEV
jgi:hypothetical protein